MLDRRAGAERVTHRILRMSFIEAAQVREYGRA